MKRRGKRWGLVSCLVFLAALAVLIPARAQASQASTTSGGKLTSGKPVKATISNPSQEIEYTVAAAANKNVTFNVTRYNFDTGWVVLEFFEPGSSSYYTDSSFTSNGSFKFSPPVGGTWTALLVPVNSAVGSLTLKMT